VVPARLGSKRLPRKALAPIAGRPLVAHVADRAGAAACVGRVVVATDSVELERRLGPLGLTTVLTGPASHGTARCLLALRKLLAAGAEEPAVVVNVQGDQPRLTPAHVDAAVHMVRSGFDVGTVAAPLSGAPERPERVKVVVRGDGHAQMFSRAPIPHGGPYLHHVGVYAFTPMALARCVACEPWDAVAAEDLEQLPWLQAGVRIGVARVDHAEEPVDSPVDLDRLRQSAGGGDRAR